jgi:energy-coupling factor transporter ATP-binding protein EcfA2
MRLVSLAIDPQSGNNRIHLGPFVAGLNAVFGTRGSGKSTIAKFIRGLLYHRHRDASGYGQDAVDGLVGSLQWADPSGATRVISSADAVSDRDYRFEGPYYHSRKNSSLADAAYPNALTPEQPWQRIGGEIFDAVLCGRLGEVLPERLWQAARELGIHVSTGHDQDEVYRRLKAEENRLQERLHHLRVDDRDREWWSAERERLAARLNDLQKLPAHRYDASLPFERSAIASPQDSVSAAEVRDWESQRTQLLAEQSALQTREVEIQRRLLTRQRPMDQAADNAASSTDVASHGRYPRTTSIYRDPFGTWTGYAKPIREQRDYAWKQRASDSLSIEDLERELETVRHRISQVRIRLADLVNLIQNRRQTQSSSITTAWEGEELRVRLNYAEEVLKSWDLYEQTRRRLADVQAQIRGHGPYQEAFRSSFMQCVERYVRELSAGALRQLPTWALEALRRDLGYAAGLSTNRGRLESYREVYRDYRPDTNRIDYPVPPSQSSERQLVELAMRMAILESAAHRIGRLPLILDDALDGFHGQNLDHIVRVLIEFAREGQQVLLMTSEPEVAERVRVHHGWVSHLTESDNLATQVAAPRLYRDREYDETYRTLRTVTADDYRHNLAEVNAMLASAEVSPFDIDPGSLVGFQASDHAFAPRPDSRFALSEASPIEDAPGMRSPLGQRLRQLGIHTVGQFLMANLPQLADQLGHRFDLQRSGTASFLHRRQAEARLMCGVPKLRLFDARVLVGCGFESAASLSRVPHGELVRIVERFLMTAEGQELMRTASSNELSRITSWISAARQTPATRDYSARPTRRSERRRSRTRFNDAAVGSKATSTRSSRTRRRTARSTQVSGYRRTTLKFYLDPSSPVVDAPSIGPRLAERLQPLGIHTVSDLFNADADRLASQLADKRITSQTIIDWQQQASLVCRIPNLRGHDAQMLVAAGIAEPEQLVEADPDELLASVAKYASSKEGQRQLRGAGSADANEIQQWVAWARDSRLLQAA